MNPEVQELISRVLANEMPIDVFYVRMGQLGVLPSEAQTMLSQAAGGTPQGMDPALESNRSEPINRSAYDYAPPQTATFSRDQYAPTETGLERIQRRVSESPIGRAVDVARSAFDPSMPAMAAGNGPGASPAGGAGPAQFSQMQPGNTDVQQLVEQYRRGQIGAEAFSSRLRALNYDISQITQLMVDANNPRVSSVNVPSPANVQPQSAPTPTPTREPYVVQQFENSGSPYVGSPYQSTEQIMAEQPNENRRFPALERAVNVARQAPVQRSAASAQTTPAQQQGPQSGADMSPLAYFIRGRFGEAGKGSPFDDRLTAYQEARDRQGDNKSMASGGQVNSKGGKGDAVHKALEIIQQLLSNR